MNDREIGLGNAIQCDVQKYRSCIDFGNYQEAARLVRGEFCEDLIIPGCVDLEHMLENVRTDFCQSFAELLDEPLDPPLFRQVQGVVGVKKDLPDHFSGHLEIGEAPFIGRTSEQRLLSSAWEEATTQVKTALVVGEPGIGKSRLCTRVVKKTVLRGWRSIAAVGYEVQRNVPYGIVSQLLHEAHDAGLTDLVEPRWLAVLSEVCPAIQPTTPVPLAPSTGAHRFAAAFGHSIAKIASVQPITIWIDDLQWVDSASLALLHYIATCRLSIPAFILFAARPEVGTGSTLNSWTFDAKLTLRGLSLSETKHWASQCGRIAEAASIQNITGGNPLLIDAILNREVADQATLPPGVREYFEQEVKQLDSEAKAVGAALGVFGGALETLDLAWLVEMSEEDVADGLEKLLSRDFAKLTDQGRFALRHDVLSEALLGNLPIAALAKLHGRAAYLMGRQGKPAAIVATQLAVAGDDAQTFIYASRAAEASAKLYAYREAQFFYEMAIASSESAVAESESRSALSQVYLRQGDVGRAQTVLAQFTRDGELDESALAALEANRLISRLAEAGPPATTREAFENARRIESLLPPDLAVTLYIQLAVNSQQGLIEQREAAERALLLLKKIQPGPHRVRQEVTIAAIKAITSTDRADLTRLDELTESAKKWPGTYVSCLAATSLIRIARGRSPAALECLLEALELSERYGFVDQRLAILNNLGVCYLEQGRWGEAEAQLSPVGRFAGGLAPKEAPSALVNLLTLEYERENFKKAAELAQANLMRFPLPLRLRLGSLGVLGLAQLEMGRLAQARQTENEIRTDPAADTGWSNDVSYLEIFMARMGMIDGHREKVESRLVQKVREFRTRDFYCAARMEVERIRITATHAPDVASREAEALRPRLAEAYAAPLVEKLDRIRAASGSRASV